MRVFRHSSHLTYAVAAAVVTVIATFPNRGRFTTNALSSSSIGMVMSGGRDHVVVIGGGIQGACVAYYLATAAERSPKRITIVEAEGAASAASGKGGGFMARSWGDGSPTRSLHEVSFDLYPSLCRDVKCTSFRTLPVLSVAPGNDNTGLLTAKKNTRISNVIPNWLDGNTGTIQLLDSGDAAAQITPSELVHNILHTCSDTIHLVFGECTGVTTTHSTTDATKLVTGVTYIPRTQHSNNSNSGKQSEVTLDADAVVVCAGPWSCIAEDWFKEGGVQLPMEGIKSTSIVWKCPKDTKSVDATALFCGEDSRFDTHLEVYPRPDGTVYICGIGGSEYVSKEDLKAGAYRDECHANELRVDAAVHAFVEMSTTYADEGELDRVQACMRPCPPDALPYIGKIPGFDGAYINAGHNCWGIAWAPGCGKAMAELILEGESTTIDLTPFDPARFSKVGGRGGRGRKRHGESVGEQW